MPLDGKGRRAVSEDLDLARLRSVSSQNVALSVPA